MKMHFLTFVFVPKHRDIEAAVAERLRPFGAEHPVAPWKKHLDRQEILRMASAYSTKPSNLSALASHMEDWNGGTGGIDENGLFALHTFNPDTKWDWYEIGGRWSVFPGNAMKASSLLRSPKLADILPHDFVTPDGRWHEVETFFPKGWMRGAFVRKTQKRWLSEFRKALAAFPDSVVVSVDRHC